MTSDQNNESRPVRILFVLPSLLRGGAETQTVNLVNGLDPMYFEKHLVTFEKELDQKDRIDTQSVNFHHFPRRWKLDWAPALEMARLIEEARIDVVHCSLQIALFMGWLAVRLSRRKPRLLVALHTTLNRNSKDEWFDRLLYQWLMRSCDKVICVCRAQEQHWQAKYPFLEGKTKVIYNGVDPDWFNPEDHRRAGEALRRQLGIPEQANVICHIAGFRVEKRHDILVQAFAKLVERNVGAFLLLVGDGILRPDMEDRVRNDHLTDHVRFLGNLADVRPALAASDCSVIASTAETFSIAMLESLSMGVPMVATDIGGTKEAVLDGETGILVEPGDANQLAEAFVRMLSNDESRFAMGTAARQSVIAHFTHRRMISDTSALLLNLFPGKNRLNPVVFDRRS